MITVKMTPAQVQADPIQKLYDNGSYIIEATHIGYDDTTAHLTFFVMDKTGKDMGQSYEYSEAKAFADTLSELDRQLAA